MTAPKLCECGCGQPAPIAKKTDSRKGMVKGQPTRFVIVEKWERPEDQQAHFDSADMITMAEGCAGLLAGPPMTWAGGRRRGSRPCRRRPRRWPRWCMPHRRWWGNRPSSMRTAA